MITCYVRYEIDPYKVPEFEEYARMWISVVNRLGGVHNGFFLPSGDTDNQAVCLMTFPSLAAYEEFTKRCAEDDDCLLAQELARETGCIRSSGRSFLRPVFD